MNVRRWMTPEPLTTAADTDLMSALAEMGKKKVRRLPVVGNGKLVGIITKSDIYAALGPLDNLNDRLSHGKLNVGAHMTSNPVTIVPDAHVEDAASEMYRRRISGLPVLEEGRLVGVITETDIFRAFVELLGFTESGALVEFDLDKPDHLLTNIRKKTADMVVRNLLAYQDSRTGRIQVRMKLRGRELSPTTRMKIPGR